jgi:hypothetical protein
MGPACQADLIETVRVVFLAGLTGGTAEKRAVMGCNVEEGELDDDEAEKVAAALLVHLPPSVPPTAAGRGGAARAQKLAGVDGYGYREGDGEEEYV